MIHPEKQLLKEKCSYKLLLIAPSGIHLRNFLDLVENSASEIHIITSEPLIFETNQPVTFVDFSLTKAKNHYETIDKIRRVYREFQPDIVHVHQLNSVSYFTVKALKKYKTPIIATAWGTDVLILPTKGLIHRELVRYILKNATAFTSDSAFMSQRMRELVPEKKLDITLCNFGVAKPIFNLPKEKIIYANRLHKPLYRVDKIIEAFKKFRDTPNGNSWQLVIAATGSETPSLQKLTTDLEMDDSVLFVGWLEREDNMKWYARSKVWVSVPESDATAISLLEAMYYGCYPVVSDLPASHEWIENGKNGRIVSNVNSSFLNGIDEVDFEAVSDFNFHKIDQEATFAIAREKFREVHCKYLGQ